MNEFDRFWRRMEELGIKTQAELAEVLSRTPQAVNDAKTRGVVPDAWAPVIARESGVSMEWVLGYKGFEKFEKRTGVGTTNFNGGQERESDSVYYYYNVLPGNGKAVYNEC